MDLQAIQIRKQVRLKSVCCMGGVCKCLKLAEDSDRHREGSNQEDAIVDLGHYNLQVKRKSSDQATKIRVEYLQKSWKDKNPGEMQLLSS